MVKQSQKQLSDGVFNFDCINISVVSDCPGSHRVLIHFDREESEIVFLFGLMVEAGDSRRFSFDALFHTSISVMAFASVS
jgi:hypothetical protein